MDEILLTRALFGTTMAFHIIFATMGVALPLMILSAEILYQKTKDKDYAVMAKRWIKGFAILLAVAIPSGTIAGVQLSLLWPGYMKIIGEVVPLPFQIEIFAFFIEALFLSIYVYAADRLSPLMRIVSVSLVAFGAAASAVLITNAHAFQNTPVGFRIVEGQIVDVDPWAAFFNPNFIVAASHVLVTAYMTGAFMLASVAAFKMLKASPGSSHFVYYRKALMLGLIIGGLFSIFSAVTGHESAIHLHHYNPEKLAAAEGLFETRSHAPLKIGGWTDPETQEVKYAIEIPGLLSFLAGYSFDEVVRGLNDFPKEYWPPLFVRVLFNGMVGIGMLLIVLSIIGFIWRHILKRDVFPKWMMSCFVVSGPLAMLAIELGWIFACIGRQPWAIYRVLSTADAATTAGHIAPLFVLFTGLYVVLGIITVLVLYFYFKRHPLAEEIPV
ncbi:cytochrome d ubiquinol oxidase subunit I [Caldalkalibacillus uzonensis]|uniref:Cytochrome d ubiquinol oxidase subunit I n=1 Tax=Caldalkalibacillus uzonensis TaxID=353224 RepID=A0ABU0CNS1_9BACI|nr:cytochrome ubiquinol oxidase subunit I [Caldalkalibacillus uzonensis]MDQ0338065.1 cytochrome d ubiquinol oxidase subunit I [Caldalkalibacillus uzonensis]